MSLAPLPETGAWSKATLTGLSQAITDVRNDGHVIVPIELPSLSKRQTVHIQAETEPALPELAQHSVTITRGDTLSTLFNHQGLPQAELYKVLAACEETEELTAIHPGQVVEFHTDITTKTLRKLVFHLDDTQTLHVVRTRGGYRSEFIQEELEQRMATATGKITHSLFLSGQEAGLSDKIIMELVAIFGWDVDFALDIREGDAFTVLYEELFKDGEKVGSGNILATEFVNQGRSLRAIRYTDRTGRTDYYSPDGRSMRKAFLRTPVKFSRISSRFTARRWHPALHKFRAHRGVDYAAPQGTTIKATGSGKITFVGRKNGYGNTVILRHGGTYTTLYAHLSRFAKGIKRGRPVRQGDVIGFVGSTGLATGPHLHYEFRINGEHRNPLTVPLPKAAPINADYRGDFQKKARPLVAQLDMLSRVQVAANDP